jgi:hypothetical protein
MYLDILELQFLNRPRRQQKFHLSVHLNHHRHQYLLNQTNLLYSDQHRHHQFHQRQAKQSGKYSDHHTRHHRHL